MTERVSGVVLAGGKGSRLGGVNKALLQVGGQTNIERVVSVLRPLCGDLLLVANDRVLANTPGVRLIIDQEPHAGVLPALAQGLRNVSGDLAIVVACDMPFLHRELLAEQLQRCLDVDVVMPLIEGRPEPMHAVYRRASCLEAVSAALEAGEQRMISFLDRLRVEYFSQDEVLSLDPELRSFFNTNTPQDLEQAQRIAASEQQGSGGRV